MADERKETFTITIEDVRRSYYDHEDEEHVTTETLVDRIERKAVAEVARQALDKCNAKCEAAIDEAITETVQRVIDETVDSKVRPVVEKIIDDGFKQTDTWGTVKGVVTVADYVRERLTKDRYGRGLVSDLVTKHVDSCLKSPDMQKAIEDAKRAIIKEVDDVLRGKIAHAVRSAAGLK